MGIEPGESTSRRRLAKVLRTAGDMIRIGDAVHALAVTRVEAATILSRWTGQGWVRRVGPGIYAPAPLDAPESGHVLEDPWILVPVLYGPGYIGGRSAAGHWELTGEASGHIVVLTARPVRAKTQRHHGVTFSLKHIDRRRFFGTTMIQRGGTRVAVSDLHRTVIDVLDDPAIGGGIGRVADCVAAYLAHSERNDESLLAYGDRLGNGAVFKRLGFLTERLSTDDPLVPACQNRLTEGHTRLTPALVCPRLVTRWRLRIPDGWARDPWG